MGENSFDQADGLRNAQAAALFDRFFCDRSCNGNDAIDRHDSTCTRQCLV